VIKIALQIADRNVPDVSRPRLELGRCEVGYPCTPCVGGLARNEHRLRNRSQHRVARGAPRAPGSGRDNVLGVERLYPGELFPRQEPDLLEGGPESWRNHE